MANNTKPQQNKIQQPPQAAQFAINDQKYKHTICLRPFDPTRAHVKFDNSMRDMSCILIIFIVCIFMIMVETRALRADGSAGILVNFVTKLSYSAAVASYHPIDRSNPGSCASHSTALRPLSPDLSAHRAVHF